MREVFEGETERREGEKGKRTRQIERYRKRTRDDANKWTISVSRGPTTMAVTALQQPRWSMVRDGLWWRWSITIVNAD